jgi:two-component system phosphate regulon sensor histidine kinase PhoR
VQTAPIELAVPLPRSFEVQVIPLALADTAMRTLVLARDRTRETRLDAMRADFVANASHELRTPLTSLIGFIETLRGPAEGDVAAQRRFLTIMAEQAARMHRLIDDLLSLSRIEMVEHAAPSGAVALEPLLRRVAEGFEPRLKPRGTRLELEIEAGLPSIPADADQLAQVLTNLLDNAVKYGREGGRVRLSARRVEPASGTQRGVRRPGLAIAVTDDGPGIPPEHLPRLTERFYRVDAGRSRAVGGTGLGLAIVKHIVNRHRGRLEITSAPGQGACFEVWLPEA